MSINPTPLLGMAILAAGVTQQVTSERAVFGRWRVTDSHCPSACAVSPAQAAAWRGRSVLYSDTLVRVGEAVCRVPRYVIGYWPATGTCGGARLKDFGIRDRHGRGERGAMLSTVRQGRLGLPTFPSDIMGSGTSQ